MSRHRRAARLRPWRFARALVAVAQLLMLLCALQLTGAAHVAVEMIAGTTQCIDSCSRDDDGCGEHQCPPGCPGCVCVHGHLPSTLPSSLAVPELTLLEAFLIEPPYRDAAPPTRAPSSVERPPKA